MPWGDEALEKAKRENKLIIVSIGYSACHWCHVMERESFENESIAETMNANYVSIKIDREERPDVDQVYMTAVQLMTNAGGWPLNCICLPDGRPIYGGTYFKPKEWENMLQQIADMWDTKPEIALEYAEKLTHAVQQAERLPIVEIPAEYTFQDLLKVVGPWINTFDSEEGGYNRAPKFPLPNNWQFLLRYGVLAKDESVVQHVHFTLKKIAYGGIYDQVGGGFARYSVDDRWHVPHFEKMLYDNAQLISLYSEAYQQQPDPLYKRIVEETIAWAIREMQSDEGAFYAALDADTDGVEGKYYTFSKNELEEVLQEDASLFISFFNVTEEGNWPEEKTNVLYISEESESFYRQQNIDEEEWVWKLKSAKQKLERHRRSSRTYPSLDNKKLAAWNALMLKGLVDAYRVFGIEQYLEEGQRIASFITQKLLTDNYHLLHQPEDKNRAIDGFLDDYAFVIDSFISLYEATFDEEWLKHAEQLCETALSLFYMPESESFKYSNYEDLIARKADVMDNVIPSASSAMIRVLNKLSTLMDNQSYKEIAEKVFANVFPHIEQYGSAYSNWAIQLLENVYGCYEIALTGLDATQWRKELDKWYIPNKITLGGQDSALPLLINKKEKQTKAYICIHNTCSLPQNSVEDAINLINKNRD